jgi:hypothetical protein
MSIHLIDLKAIFIDGHTASGSIDVNSELKLCDIDSLTTNLDSKGVNDFKEEVASIITGSRSVRNKSKPDPISALLMNADLSSGNEPIDEAAYQLFEKSRIADKWRGNKIGQLNELMACMLPNIASQNQAKKSGQLDLFVSNKNIIAEVKNRFNTMNAASAIKTRKNMQELVFQQSSVYKDHKAVLVERIPKTNGDEVPFSPSDPDIGMKTQDSPLIVRKGLQQFLTECGGPLVYLQGIILIAEVLVENSLLPADYDMRFIFKLLKESVT